MKFLTCLLFTCIVSAQHKPLELVIDSLKTTDKETQREFLLSYHIKNTSDKPLSFVLNPEQIIPIGAGSLSPNVYYKMYENDKPFDPGGVFSRPIQRTFDDEKAVKAYMDSMAVAFKTKTIEEYKADEKKRFSKNTQQFAPGEKKTYQLRWTWDKQRYRKQDVMEYYIDEKAKYEIELQCNLMGAELLRLHSKNEQAEAVKDQNLLKGWYTSNRVVIDFGE